MAVTNLETSVEPVAGRSQMRSGMGIDAIDRRSLVDTNGLGYRELRRTLTPRYPVVWFHLMAAQAVLVAVGVGVVLLRDTLPPYVTIPVGALLFGYVIAYIELFLHEAAHYNIAKSRTVNDLLSNVFIGSLVGQNIKAYRPIHFDHHRYLGTTHDTERTYFDPLNVRFIIESMLGVKPIKVLANRDRVLRAKDDAGANADASQVGRLQLLMGLALNAVVVLGAVFLGWWVLAAAWVLAMLIVFPFFASIRQLLEHRDEHASPDVDYTKVPHGAVTRMFHGPLAPTLGGAGFNRHLLHHWDPQVSYTRLADLERFLLDTEASSVLERSESTYLRTFVRLFAR